MNQGAQAGNDFAKLDGAEVIDLSGLPDGEPTGHLYNLHSARMGQDLARLLNEGQSADARVGLVRAGENVWKPNGTGD